MRPPPQRPPVARPGLPGGRAAAQLTSATGRVDRTTAVLVALPVIAGTALVLAVAHRAVYVSPDSVAYLGTAQNLVDGHGYTPPPGTPARGNFPPLLTLVLAAFGRAGVAPVTAVRWLNPLLLAGTALVVAGSVWSLTRSRPLTVIAAVLVITATDLLAFHSAALSEPLFIFLAVAALAVLARGLERRATWLLAAGAALAGAAFLTRYLGVAVVVAGMTALVLYGTGRRWHGAVEALVFGVAATVPVALWLLWVRHVEGRATNRDLVVHPFGLSYLNRGLRTASLWFLPRRVPSTLRVTAMALVVVALVVVAVRAAVRSRRGGRVRGPGTPLVLLLVLTAAAYVAALVVDRLLFDATGRLDARFLAFLHVLAIPLALVAIHRASLADGRQRLAAGAVAIGVILAALQVNDGVGWARGRLHPDAAGRGGYADRRWRESEVVARIAALPPATTVFTNAPEAVWFLTRRSTRGIPRHRDHLTGRANPEYVRQLDGVRAAVAGGQAVVVHFPAATFHRDVTPAEDELRRNLPVRALLTDDVGTLYAPDAAGWPTPER